MLFSMNKQTTLFLCLLLFLIYLIWLACSAAFYAPADGFYVKTRPVSEDRVLTGRDRSDSLSRLRLSGDRIDLNTADEETLRLLPGIGPALSSAIVEYRSEHPFCSAEDLMLVPGIGEKTYEALRDYVTVEPVP